MLETLDHDPSVTRGTYRSKAVKTAGFVGWRGMVGSVLMQRMIEEKDFDHFEPVFSRHRMLAVTARRSTVMAPDACSTPPTSKR